MDDDYSGRLRILILTVLVASVAYWVGQELGRTPGAEATDSSQRNTPAPIGWELVAIFVSSSDCIGNTVEGFAEAVRRSKTLVARRADSADIYFSSVGVAKDWDISNGYRYLTQEEWTGPGGVNLDLDFGEWDEISVGRNWGNTIISRFVDKIGGVCRWESESRLLVPQLVIARRYASDWRTDAQFTFDGEEVLFRLCGAHRIIEWVEKEAPLPEIEGMGSG